MQNFSNCIRVKYSATNSILDFINNIVGLGIGFTNEGTVTVSSTVYYLISYADFDGFLCISCPVTWTSATVINVGVYRDGIFTTALSSASTTSLYLSYYIWRNSNNEILIGLYVGTTTGSSAISNAKILEYGIGAMQMNSGEKILAKINKLPITGIFSDSNLSEKTEYLCALPVVYNFISNTADRYKICLSRFIKAESTNIDDLLLIDDYPISFYYTSQNTYRPIDSVLQINDSNYYQITTNILAKD